MKRPIAPHAHAAEDKAARRAAILQAARTLFAAGEGSLPAVAQVAAAAGLAKGTVYLYFRTKEEIFAALLLDDWTAVMQESQRLFRTTRGARGARVTAFLATLIDHLEHHPEVLRLDALGYGVLEKNMRHDSLAAHKAGFTVRLGQTGEVIDTALRLPPGRGLQLLMRTYALTRGLWQSYQHEAETQKAGVAPPASLIAQSFAQELREALTEYWRGALTSPSAHTGR